MGDNVIAQKLGGKMRKELTKEELLVLTKDLASDERAVVVMHIISYAMHVTLIKISSVLMPLKGFEQLSREILADKKPQLPNKKRIFANDDSRTTIAWDLCNISLFLIKSTALYGDLDEHIKSTIEGIQVPNFASLGDEATQALDQVIALVCRTLESCKQKIDVVVKGLDAITDKEPTKSFFNKLEKLSDKSAKLCAELLRLISYIRDSDEWASASIEPWKSMLKKR